MLAFHLSMNDDGLEYKLGDEGECVMSAKGYENQKITYLDEAFQVSEFEQEAVSQLLDKASRAVTNPTQSKFHVKAAAIGGNGELVSGGNREYGLTRAFVHGEEAVSSALKSLYPGSEMVGIGFYGGDPDNEIAPTIMPCGNCRDVLVAEADPSLLMVAGNEKIATLARLSSFLYQVEASPNGIDMLDLHDPTEEAVYQATKALRRSITTYLPDEMKDQAYGVSLVDTEGRIFSGGLHTTAGYDATSPAVAAIQAYRNRPPAPVYFSPEPELDEIRPIENIVIVRKSGTGELPNVLYRDRNALLEHDETLKARNKLAVPARVLLVGLLGDGEQVENVAVTNTMKWLPHPFTNNSLGMDFASEEQYDVLDRYQ